MSPSVNPEMRSLLTELLPTLVSYVETLAGHRQAVMQWRVLPEKPGLVRQKSEHVNRRGSIREFSLLEWLLTKNQEGYAVFASVNEYPAEPIKERGSGKKQHILRMRCAHADVDIGKGHAPPGWQHGMVADGTPPWTPRLLLPTMQVESVGGPHFYWVYRLGEEPSVPDGEGINRSIQQALNSDPTTCDAARILRVPGFYHWKTGEPRLVKLAFADNQRLFSGAELSQCLNDLGMAPRPVAPRHLHTPTHDGDVEVVEMTKDEYHRAFHEAQKFVFERSMTLPGARGSTLMKIICPKLHDLGIITPHALKMLRIWADKKCDQTPSEDGEWPASDEVLRDRWFRSAETRDNPRGYQIFEWRGGLASELEESYDAQKKTAQQRQQRVRQAQQKEEAAAAEHKENPTAETASQLVDAVTEHANAQEDAAEDPPPAQAAPPQEDAAEEEEEDEVDDGPDEPSEDWIEAERMERVGAGMLPVPVRTQHALTVNEVLAVLARHPDLYQFDGKIVHIRHTTTGWRIRELTKSSVITYATSHCAFFSFKMKNGEWTTKSCGPPMWLAGEVLDSHNFQAFRHLKGLTAVPRIRSDGTVSPPGYDTQTCTVYIPDEGLENLTVGETREAALKAVETLCDVLADFPLVGEEQRAASLAAMLTPFCRRAINGPAPMFMVDGNRPNIGKSYLLKVFTHMFANDVAPLNWAPPDRFGTNIYQNTQRLSSAFLSGRCILALDNLKGEFGDVVIDKLLTLSHWSERILGSSETLTVENFMTVYGTANNITLVSDVWRRVVTIRLVDAGADTRPPPRYELASYLPKVRKTMIEACLTILRAFCVAGRPTGGQLLGSFENWSRWVVAALVWLGLPDITSLVGTPEEAMEDSREQGEAEVTIHAVEQVCAKLNKDCITATEFIHALEDVRSAAGIGSPLDAVTGELQEMVSLLLRRGIRPGQRLVASDVGYLLRRYRDNSVRDSQGNMKMLVMQKDPGRRNPSTWRVKPIGKGVDVIGPTSTEQ